MTRLELTVILLLGILGSFAFSKKPDPLANKKKVSSATPQNICGQDTAGKCSCCSGRDGRDGVNGRDGRDGRDGIQGAKGEKGSQGNTGNARKNGEKGQKGESGLPGKSPRGVIKFEDTDENCTLSIAGTVRYSTIQKTLQLCDGNAWLEVLARKGHVPHNPGRHCLDLLNSGKSRGSGLYWIDPNGGSTDDSFQAFCDMETQRGGWTLVATKVSPSFLFIKSPFSPVAAKTKNADAASHIHPSMGDWEEVMFRFADVDTIRVIYNRKAGAPNKDKEEFDKYLMGKTINSMQNVNGFYKYSPADQNRNPAVGFATISRWHYYSDHGISESHGGTDKWVDMWTSPDGSNNYISSDDTGAGHQVYRGLLLSEQANLGYGPLGK